VKPSGTILCGSSGAGEGCFRLDGVLIYQGSASIFIPKIAGRLLQTLASIASSLANILLISYKPIPLGT
jgi:hypothetical protein